MYYPNGQPPEYNAQANTSFNSPPGQGEIFTPGRGFLYQDPKRPEKHAMFRSVSWSAFAVILMILVSILPYFIYQAICVFIGGQGADSFAESQTVTIIIQVASLLFPSIFLLCVAGRSFKLKSLYRRPNPDFLLSSVPMVLALSGVSVFALSLLISLLEKAGVVMGSPDFTPPSDPKGIVLQGISLMIIPAIFEELLFRGVIMHVLRRHGDMFALVVSALLFGIAHMNWIQGINAFFLGLLIGYMVIRTGSLWIGMVMHFANNALSFVGMLLSQYLGDLWGGIILLAIYGLCLILAVICCLLLSRRYGRLFYLVKPVSFLNGKDKTVMVLTNFVIIILVFAFFFFSSQYISFEVLAIR